MLRACLHITCRALALPACAAQTDSKTESRAVDSARADFPLTVGSRVTLEVDLSQPGWTDHLRKAGWYPEVRRCNAACP